MPELPEVETYVRNLRKPLVGRTITGVQVYWPRTVARLPVEAFKRQLTGLRIRAIQRRAKYLVFELGLSRSQEPACFLLVHLKMSGHLEVTSGKQPVAKHDRVTFDLDNGRRLSFNDTRKFGRMHLVAGPEEVTGKLGPEPLAEDFDAAAFKRLIGKRSGHLKPLLLNQQFIAGIGNIYADEALWLARLHPLRPAGSLDDAEIRALYRGIRKALQTGIDQKGATFDQIYPAGEYEFRVYGRVSQPCLRCGRPIQRIVVGQRSTYFCAQCQSLKTSDYSQVL